MLPLLARVPNLRQGPPNQEGMCYSLIEWPLGCRVLGGGASRITSDSRQEDLVHGFHIFLIAVMKVARRSSLRAPCLPHLNYKEDQSVVDCCWPWGCLSTLSKLQKLGKLSGLCKAWMQSFWGGRREK